MKRRLKGPCMVISQRQIFLEFYLNFKLWFKAIAGRQKGNTIIE